MLNQWGQPLGCMLFACIFLWSGWNKLMNPYASAAIMNGAGIPFSGIVVIAAWYAAVESAFGTAGIRATGGNRKLEH